MHVIPAILDSVLEPTLSMITRDFIEYPEHRIAFYKFINTIVEHAFLALLQIPATQFKLIVDSIVWGFKHTSRDIAELALTACFTFLLNIHKFSVQKPEIQNQFYQMYFLSLTQEVFVVLTDREHKPGFKLHALILSQMFHVVESGQIQAPLWKSGSYPSNQTFLREYVATILRNAFPQLSNAQIQQFVINLFSLNRDLAAFKTSLRDFLIQLNEFAGEDNRELYSEETEAEAAKKKQETFDRALRIPGMVKPMDRPDDMVY